MMQSKITNITALAYGLSHPSFMLKSLRQAARKRFEIECCKQSKIAVKQYHEILDLNPTLRLQNYHSRCGNVSILELLIISTITAQFAPKNLLEIGTFDGNTTLQLALNSPANAVVHTLDLPNDGRPTHLPTENFDQKYIADQQKWQRKYQGTSIESKVVQHLGDSALYDFQNFARQGPIDLCFIDGGHSYECVKNDTEKTLKIMSPNGIVLWHDFHYKKPGVFAYLNELVQDYPLIHFADTQLAALFLKT